MAQPLKLPPQNTEAEQSVLGALMIDKNAIIKVADILNAKDFYKTAHGKIYAAILDLYAKHQPIDILSVTSKLKEDKQLDGVGGSSYLSRLINSVPTASHIEHYAKIVKEKGILRDLISASAEITEKAFDQGDNVENVLDEIEQKIFSISQNSQLQKFVNIKDELQSAYERIEKLHSGGANLRGVPTGFAQLDNLLSGLQKADLIMLGARPSLGKTSLVLDIARYAAAKGKLPVGVFSLEMSTEQVVDRLISAEAQVPLWKLRTGKLTDDTDFQLVQNALDNLSVAPIFIDDTPSPNILQMRSMARRLQMDHGLSLLIIDYLQLIQPRTSSESMVQQVTEISRSLKGLARELNIPVLAVSQLSRAVDQREYKVPRLSDLRESGCLTGDSLIMRADTGEMLAIKSLAERVVQAPIPVYALNENWKLTVRPMTKAFSSGKKMVYQLRTRSGRVIKASANHPFRKLDNWYRLDQLKTGDRIALPRQLQPSKPANNISDDELVLLAHLLGDGCVLPNQPFHYTSGDFENILIVKETAQRLFNIGSRVVNQKNWWHIYLPSPYRLARGKPHPITKWFRDLGIGLRHSYEKKIPASVFQCSSEKISLFLRHLWATDGNISQKLLKNRSPAASIYYGSTSQKLAEQVQHLLLRLGIHGVLKAVPQHKFKREYRSMYHVYIQGKENQLRFLTLVGCVGKRGRIIPQLVTALRQIIANPNTDVIPREAWHEIVEPAKTAAGIGWCEVSVGLNTAYCGSTLFKHGIGRNRMARLAQFLQKQTLDDLAASDVYWDEIVEVAPLGIEEVYDATVAGDHNFIANDIVVHNSLEQDSDVVLFIYRKDRDKQNVTPEEENTIELIIAKHRNGPLGTVKLKFDPEKASFRNIDTIH